MKEGEEGFELFLREEEDQLFHCPINQIRPKLVRGQIFRQAEAAHINDEDSKNRYAAQNVNGLDALLAKNWPDHGRRYDSVGQC